MEAGLPGLDREQAFLAKAQEAEQFASLTKDAGWRDIWLAIAESYRDLAETAEGGTATSLPSFK